MAKKPLKSSKSSACLYQSKGSKHSLSNDFTRYADFATFGVPALEQNLFVSGSSSKHAHLDANVSSEKINYHKPTFVSSVAKKIRRSKSTVAPKDVGKTNLAFDDWCKKTNEREREEKRLERERVEALAKEKAKEKELRKEVNDAKIAAWHRKKDREIAAKKKQQASIGKVERNFAEPTASRMMAAARESGCEFNGAEKAGTALHKCRKVMNTTKTQKIFKNAMSHTEWCAKKNMEARAKKSIFEKRMETRINDPRVGKKYTI